MISSLSVNQPFGRNHVLVCAGDGGMLKKVKNTISRVRNPLWEGRIRASYDIGKKWTHSIMNNHLKLSQVLRNEHETSTDRDPAAPDTRSI